MRRRTRTSGEANYLNMWVLAHNSWLEPGQWKQAEAARARTLPAKPAGTVAINDMDGQPGRCGYVLAVLHGDEVLLQGRAFPSRRALWAALEELTKATARA